MFGLRRQELLFAAIISSVHAVQHIFYRLVPPLIPVLAVDIDAPLWQLGLLVSIYMFVGGLFQAPFGILADRVNRQYIASASISAMATGYVIFSLSPIFGASLPPIELFGDVFTGPFQLMALAMIVAGIGYSGIHPVGYPLITANVSSDSKGKVLGMWGSASKIGDALAPILIGVFILLFSWELILLSIAVLGYGYAIWLFVYLSNSQFDTQPPRANKTDSSDGIVSELSRADSRQFLFPVAILLAFFFAILFAGNGLLAFAPVFVTDVYGISLSIVGISLQTESVANFYFALLLLSATVSQLATGTFADWFDHRTVIVILLTIATICFVTLAFFTLSPVLLAIVFVVLGGSLYGLNPVRDALISNVSPADYEGRTFGYVYTVALIGSSAFPAAIGYMGDIVGIQLSFIFLAVGTLLGLVAILPLYSTKIYKKGNQ
ncbi:MFS transporter [Natronococcus occultus]|uniref:Sugar phosphate permease n=1 Tax=Natronococcus occultus SP4 TaxID=694430 RepID=L0JXP3_9EURY|nr:MFS transporter [Natronococcus occultus]AGB37080.1 sugar phosphate permease [Natronococcus occultus SP4]